MLPALLAAAPGLMQTVAPAVAGMFGGGGAAAASGGLGGLGGLTSGLPGYEAMFQGLGSPEYLQEGLMNMGSGGSGNQLNNDEEKGLAGMSDRDKLNEQAAAQHGMMGMKDMSGYGDAMLGNLMNMAGPTGRQWERRKPNRYENAYVTGLMRM